LDLISLSKINDSLMLHVCWKFLSSPEPMGNSLQSSLPEI
jgi:hypothetical protein